MRASLPANAVDRLLDRHISERGQGQGKKQAYPAVENGKSFAVGASNLFRCAFHRRRVGYSPVSGQRLSGPERANFFGRVITNGEDEIHDGRIRRCKFVPRFATQVSGGDSGEFKLLECLRLNSSRRMTASAVGSENAPRFAVQNGFGHDGAGRISGAQEQNVVETRHAAYPFLTSLSVGQQLGSQHDSLGLVARMNALANFPSTS